MRERTSSVAAGTSMEITDDDMETEKVFFEMS